MQLHGAQVLVIGLGISGEAAAAYAGSTGAEVTVTDTATANVFQAAQARLKPYAIRYQLGADSPDPKGFDLVVRSPGVPYYAPALAAARAAGVPVWSETELGYTVCPCPLIAVTGTNGKGTTTTLITAILRAAGRTAYAAGNIGTPLTAIVPSLGRDDVVVLEVSAAQLEDSPSLAPATAVLTNIRPEHQNLYSWDYYRTLKARILRHHSAVSSTVANLDDPTCRALTETVPGRRSYTSVRGPLPAGLDGAYVAGQQVITRQSAIETHLCDLAELSAPGCVPNALLAAATALSSGIDHEPIRNALRSYRGREHVLEHVGTWDGVDYYNDAKATNPYSVAHALDALHDRKVILIAGGFDDKHGDFTVLTDRIARRVTHLVAFGPTATKVVQAARDRVVTQIADTFTEATVLAHDAARPGLAILFSPGTHSKHLNPDYLTRGVLFRRHVQQLNASRAPSSRPER